MRPGFKAKRWAPQVEGRTKEKTISGADKKLDEKPRAWGHRGTPTLTFWRSVGKSKARALMSRKKKSAGVGWGRKEKGPLRILIL